MSSLNKKFRERVIINNATIFDSLTLEELEELNNKYNFCNGFANRNDYEGYSYKEVHTLEDFITEWNKCDENYTWYVNLMTPQTRTLPNGEILWGNAYEIHKYDLSRN